MQTWAHALQLPGFSSQHQELQVRPVIPTKTTCSVCEWEASEGL